MPWRRTEGRPPRTDLTGWARVRRMKKPHARAQNHLLEEEPAWTTHCRTVSGRWTPGSGTRLRGTVTREQSAGAPVLTGRF